MTQFPGPAVQPKGPLFDRMEKFMSQKQESKLPRGADQAADPEKFIIIR